MLRDDSFGSRQERDAIVDAVAYASASGSEGNVCVPVESVTIMFATETGASEDVAKELGKLALEHGIQSRVLDMADLDSSELDSIDVALFIASTTGDGDAPYAAEGFFTAIECGNGDRLDHLRYAVLALGDATYEHFCAAGRRLDEALARRGAMRLLERVDCDVDYEDPAASWRSAVLEAITERPVVSTPGRRPIGPAAARLAKFSPSEVTVIESRVLTGEGSTKATRHLAFAISEDDTLHYEPGDALGVIVANSRDVVAAVLEASGLHADARIILNDEALKLGDALHHYLDITTVTPRFLEAWALVSDSPELAADVPAARAALMRGYHVVDLMRKHPAKISDAQSLVGILRPLQPRLYSIASSLKATPGEVHLTIAPVCYSLWGHRRLGVATGQLCERTLLGAKLQVYVQVNAHFRLPKPGVPIIMIGAGTGVAPYRAFLQEMAAQGSTSRAWLFFGERNQATDFLYRDEFTEYLGSGVLTRLDTAFSRDSISKFYVQHRLIERADELCRWIEDGAHIYVCGDAVNMAPDVHRALLTVIETGMGASGQAAEAYLATLQGNGRYQRDVY